ncbi:hypothetical protein ANAEL_02221 [Anaerolineales bacterium]|nr:hypothetical protein ANAEL_02221 [Anaerolineales bacterium]
MSIVICTVINNSRLLIGSDHRAIRDGQIYDNYQKIYNLKPTIFFAMTGIAENGLSIFGSLQQMSNQSSADIISAADNLLIPSESKLTIMLAGKSEDGNFFVWQKNNNGQIAVQEITSDKASFSISTTDNIDIIINCFRGLLSIIPPQIAISETIKFASTIDNTISLNSSVYELV